MPCQEVEDFFAKQEPDQHQQQGLLPPADDMFRGLRVRMAVATGVAETVKLHKVTGRVEYWGQVMDRVQAMAEAPEGGQVCSLQHMGSLHGFCLSVSLSDTSCKLSHQVKSCIPVRGLIQTCHDKMQQPMTDLPLSLVSTAVR